MSILSFLVQVNKPSVLHQLVCSGVMAALEVRRAGFPNRMLYRDFVKEFRVFTPPGAKFRNMIDDEVWRQWNGEQTNPSEPRLNVAASAHFAFLCFLRLPQELAMEMLLHPAVSARVPLSAFRPGNTKLFMSADTPFVLRNLRHTLLYPYVRRLQLWWQRRENDVNQRKVASAKRNITAAQDKAALCAVHGVASVRKATEVTNHFTKCTIAHYVACVNESPLAFLLQLWLCAHLWICVHVYLHSRYIRRRSAFWTKRRRPRSCHRGAISLEMPPIC